VSLSLQAAVLSDIGPARPNNEDAVFASPRIVAVADGVGGAAAGEVASATAIGAVAELDKCRLTGPLEPALRAAVARGNETIGFIAACRPRLAGMSTTLTVVALADDGAYVVANVGDSRSYLLRGGALIQLTRDDSLVQELIESGALAPAEARGHPRRSLVLAALDGAEAREPKVETLRARVGDRLLLCSDGLTDVVADDDVARALADPSRGRCAERLLALALEAGARDNVSVVVADVVARAAAGSAWA
jgi:PPM family protein phosphatase